MLLQRAVKMDIFFYMKVLFLGEIVGRCGIGVIKKALKDFKRDNAVDLVIANAEGATSGFGLGFQNAITLQHMGIDIITMGEKSFYKIDMVEGISKRGSILRPANYPETVPGRGIRYLTIGESKVCIINPVFQMGQTDPVEIAKAAIEHARKHGNDLVFLDTAGRLHIDEELMAELCRIRDTVEPAEIMLVVDAMTGQDAVNAATAFDEALGVTGVMLSKLDGDARGGAALSIRAATGKPIKFIGVGEKLDMIEPFHPDRMASRILGMGDVLTLIEKAEQSFDQQKALEAAERLKANRFTLADYLDQMAQIKNMGDLGELMGMIPGMDAKALKGAKLDEKAMARQEAIILSMTKAERENPSMLNSSRKKRIAAGSGTSVVDVNRLLKQFEAMQQMMKQLSGKNMKKLQKKMGRMGGGFPGMGGGFPGGFGF